MKRKNLFFVVAGVMFILGTVDATWINPNPMSFLYMGLAFWMLGKTEEK